MTLRESVKVKNVALSPEIHVVWFISRFIPSRTQSLYSKPDCRNDHPADNDNCSYNTIGIAIGGWSVGGSTRCLGCLKCYRAEIVSPVSYFALLKIENGKDWFCCSASRKSTYNKYYNWCHNFLVTIGARGYDHSVPTLFCHLIKTENIHSRTMIWFLRKINA